MFFSLVYSLLLRALTYRNYLSSLQLVLCRMAAVKRLPVHHHTADYIFWSFGIIEFIQIYFSSRVWFKPVLEGVAVVAHCTTGHEQTQLT